MASHKEKELKKLQKKTQVQKSKVRPKSSSSWPTIIGVSVIVVIITIFFISQMESPVSTQGLEPLSLTQPSSYDNTRGNGSIFFIKYSDFQCPACAAYSPLLKQMMDDYGEHITFAYRHFPLTQLHANAVEAARASEAAARQDAFWQYHDVLFEKQTEWENLGNPEPFFIQYAVDLGLDESQFIADLESPEVIAIVQHNLNDAKSRSLGGTPSLFINGRPLVDVSTYEDLARQIEREIR